MRTKKRGGGASPELYSLNYILTELEQCLWNAHAVGSSTERLKRELQFYSFFLHSPRYVGPYLPLIHHLDMFAVQLSYVSILRVVAERCHLPLVSPVAELSHDGDPVHGIEIELPTLFRHDRGRRVFFWSSSDSVSLGLFEDAAFQALVFLQDLYGFTIVDYSYQTMLRQREFMQHLFRVANRGVQLARVVIATSHGQLSPPVDAVRVADHLLQDLHSMLP